jgi:hypothetical protein
MQVKEKLGGREPGMQRVQDAFEELRPWGRDRRA